MDNLVERQTIANDNIEEMLSETKLELQEALAGRDRSEGVAANLAEEVRRMTSQLNELQGLVEMYRQKYMWEKRLNREDHP